jgi:hypothetical protein
MGPGRAGSLLPACFSTEWIHPNKPAGELSKVYNKCQMVALQNPKVQQGSQFLFLNATKRSV